MQETFLAVVDGRGVEGYDPTRPLMPWLVGILQTMVKRSRRSAVRVPDPDRLPRPADAPTESTAAERGEEGAHVRSAIDALDEPYRSVALLRWRYGLGPAEIADVRNEPPGTTRSLLSRAVDRLKVTLHVVPGVLLGFGMARGLHSVREAVMKASMPGAAAAAGGATATALLTAKTAAIAAVVVAAGVGGYFTFAPVAKPTSNGAADEAALAANAEADVAPPPREARPGLAGDARRIATRERSGVASPDAPRAGSGAGAAAPTRGSKGEADLSARAAVDATAETDDGTTSGVTVTPIDAAIRRGVEWLESKQQNDGSWAGGGDGLESHATAAAVFTLLGCRVPERDGAVTRGLRNLFAHDRVPTSTVGTADLLTAVAATARASFDEPDPRLARRTLSGLNGAWAEDLKGLLVRSRSKLGWAGEPGPEAGATAPSEDIATTCAAALALFAAEQDGIKTPSEVWNGALALALAVQEPESAVRARWPGDRTTPRGFRPVQSAAPGDPTATESIDATACALATIAVARNVLASRQGDKTWAKRDAKAVDRAVVDGLAWLDANWTTLHAMGAEDGSPVSFWVAALLETALDLLTVETVGTHAWYPGIAARLVGTQQPSGFWGSAQDEGRAAVAYTCLALQFLARPWRTWKGAIPPAAK